MLILLLLLLLLLSLLLLLLLLLSTVSASATREIDSVSITRLSLADIFFIFITFSALGYYFPVIDANLDQHCLPLGYAFPGHEPNFGLKCDTPTYVHNSNFESIIRLCITQTNNPQTTVISGLRK